MNICKVAIAIFVFSASIGCKPTMKGTTSSKPEELEGQWKLTAVLQDTSILSGEFGEKKPFITIDHAEHQLQGFSGCNSFGGGFETKGDSIKILPLTANQMGCLNNGESILFRQLAKTNRFEVSKDSLILLANDTVLLSFSKAKKVH